MEVNKEDSGGRKDVRKEGVVLIAGKEDTGTVFNGHCSCNQDKKQGERQPRPQQLEIGGA